jgi:putative DNA primase/helicase
VTIDATAGPRTQALSKGKAALGYNQRLGASVLPVWSVREGICTCPQGNACTHPGKHPDGSLVRHGLSDASTDPAVIASWWEAKPDANIGLACTFFFASDIDGPEGEAALAALVARHGPLPATWEQITGRGRQLWFWPVDGLRTSAGVLGPQLDIRSHGSYVLAPPSTHACGATYRWLPERHPARVPLAPAPDWMIEHLQRRRQYHRPGETPERRSWEDWFYLLTTACRGPDGVNPGARNETLTSIAGGLMCDHSYHAVLAVLHLFNTTQCQPPLAASEVEQIARSILRRATGEGRNGR